MIGTVTIRDLEIRCIVGILPRERVEPQSLFLDVDLDLDFAPAAEAEDVSKTIDYAAVSAWLTGQVQARKYQLVETLAVEGCHGLLEAHPAVQRVRIEVKKPAAVPAAAHVGCIFEARRGKSS